jgi:tellurite resistance protein TehA-like permease
VVRRAGTVTRAVRRAEPAWFAMVMATGIVSAALRQADWPGPARVLLGGAAACFVVIAVAVGWRAVRHPAGLAAELGQPQRIFTAFAAVAACAVLGNGLTGAGPGAAAARIAAAVLAGAALLLWLALTGWALACLGRWLRSGRPVTAVNGTWYLWAVGTQSLAIAAAFLHTGGLLAARRAAAAAIAAWSAGLALYLVIMILVAVRLLLAGLGPGDATAPYWVAMGAASISAFAAARTAPLAGAAFPAARPVIACGGIAAWILATCLIPVLAVFSIARLARPPRLRYGTGGWVFVFPLGMYATAGLTLSTVAGLPSLHHVGAVAVWPAAAAWATTAFALVTAPLARRGDPAPPGATAPAPATTATAPARAPSGGETAQVTR